MMHTAPLDLWLPKREWYVRGMINGDPRQAPWSFEAEFPGEKICVQRPSTVVDRDPPDDYMWVLNIQFVYPPPNATALPTYRLLLDKKVVASRDSDILPEIDQPWPIFWEVGLKKS